MSLPATATSVLLATAAAVAAIGLSGCSASGISKTTLQNGVKAKLDSSLGAQFQSVTCDSGLPAKVGATTRCVVVNPAGTRIGSTITVTAVHGNQIDYHIQNDDQALGSSGTSATPSPDDSGFSDSPSS